MVAPSSTNPPPDEQRAHLTACRVIAVVGLSPHPHRDSHRVAAYLQAAGYRIVPVHPRVAAQGGTVLGEKAYATLTDAAREHPIDLVDVFRRSEDVSPVADEAIAIGARGLWLQQGITHEAAAQRARAAGLWVVQDRCLMVEHRWLMASPRTA